MRFSNAAFLSTAVLTVALAALFAASLTSGSVEIPLNEIWLILSGRGSSNTAWHQIILNLRMPRALTAGLAGAVSDGEWWRLVTSAFLHSGTMHILFNMYALYLFGPRLEREAGSVPFAVVNSAGMRNV